MDNGKPIDHDGDIAIAQGIRLRPIEEIAAALGVPPETLFRYGPYKGKIDLKFAAAAMARPRGKLILVTAISPTPAGEGKTTTSIGLGDALRRAGARTAIALREPSLGPCFGAKGGATGGGQAQIAPMHEINLHFTGDLHAITAAHNLLAAMIDNHLYWGNALDLDPRRITWRRVLDLNDRALRDIVVGLGGPANGAPRQTGFDITAASEVMAIFCLARSLADLEQRLGDIVIGRDTAKRQVRARALKAAGAMTALLKDAFAPNLVQTLEGTPALVHGGPFANIAHGCNSVIATETALGLADFVVTEAGFGADLGAEKFLDIKCRKAGLEPAACVVVATVRALKMHGGVALKALGAENVPAVQAGCANLLRHVENMRKFGLPVVVAVNRFTADTAAELAAVTQACAAIGVQAIACNHWAEGGAGAAELAAAVLDLTSRPAEFRLLYADAAPLEQKIRTIAAQIYGAAEVQFDPQAQSQLQGFEQAGFGALPVCMAKTQYSFSANPAAKGAPQGFGLRIREARLAAGAGFVVALCGEILTMPGLPRHAAAEDIFLDEFGEIGGLS
ncbi:MAG: formate--tetrahydrofolate ligase [Rhodospirillales bacterium 20-64-7]|nr:MAG: formate--tetrahydrofolate ligase [Rhodospirillales bacterium 20-64-7]